VCTPNRSFERRDIERRNAFITAANVFAFSLIGLVVLGSLGLPGRLVSAEPLRFAISIQQRKIDPAQRTIRVTQGKAVELAFTADEPMELHLHGYDLLLTVEPGARAVMRLDAGIAGRFAIAAHRFDRDAGKSRSARHVVLLYLEVHPR
jgi:hypothetical protein